MSVAFRALGDEVRLAIIEMLLREDEVCACRFLDCCSVSQPTLSYHLKELREAGLIKGRKDGLWVYYRLERGRFDEIVRYLTRYLAPSGA
jgi:ArsR family transcriptional regulator